MWTPNFSFSTSCVLDNENTTAWVRCPSRFACHKAWCWTSLWNSRWEVSGIRLTDGRFQEVKNVTPKIENVNPRCQSFQGLLLRQSWFSIIVNNKQRFCAKHGNVSFHSPLHCVSFFGVICVKLDWVVIHKSTVSEKLISRSEKFVRTWGARKVSGWGKAAPKHWSANG